MQLATEWADDVQNMQTQCRHGVDGCVNTMLHFYPDVTERLNIWEDNLAQEQEALVDPTTGEPRITEENIEQAAALFSARQAKVINKMPEILDGEYTCHQIWNFTYTALLLMARRHADDTIDRYVYLREQAGEEDIDMDEVRAEIIGLTVGRPPLEPGETREERNAEFVAKQYQLYRKIAKSIFTNEMLKGSVGSMIQTYAKHGDRIAKMETIGDFSSCVVGKFLHFVLRGAIGPLDPHEVPCPASEQRLRHRGIHRDVTPGRVNFICADNAVADHVPGLVSQLDRCTEMDTCLAVRLVVHYFDLVQPPGQVTYAAIDLGQLPLAIGVLGVFGPVALRGGGLERRHHLAAPLQPEPFQLVLQHPVALGRDVAAASGPGRSPTRHVATPMGNWQDFSPTLGTCKPGQEPLHYYRSF